MKKIEVHIHGLANDRTTYNYSYQDAIYRPFHLMPLICGTILGDFSFTNILRDTLNITFHKPTSDFNSLLRSHLLPKLCPLNGFRTLIIDMTFKRYENRLFWRRDQLGDKIPKRIRVDFEQVIQAIRDEMEP